MCFFVFFFSGVDEEEAEEEEGMGEEETGGDDNDEDEDEEEEEEEEDNFDPTLKEKKINFGETSHYCPYTLHKLGILVPGSAELQCKYRERIYRFQSDEARQAFFDKPETYLPTTRSQLKPPAIRIFVLGPRQSGKSTQARLLAQKLDVFHIKFRDYLQVFY